MKEGTPRFSRKAVYQLWSDQNKKNWRRHDNELESAEILIREAANLPNKNGLYAVEPIPLHKEDGFVAIGFALPELLRKWGGRIREICLDSACRCLYISMDLAYISQGTQMGQTSSFSPSSARYMGPDVRLATY
jgi:hypothetical protein